MAQVRLTVDFNALARKDTSLHFRFVECFEEYVRMKFCHRMSRYDRIVEVIKRAPFRDQEIPEEVGRQLQFAMQDPQTAVASPRKFWGRWYVLSDYDQTKLRFIHWVQMNEKELRRLS